MDVAPKFFGDPQDAPWKRWATSEIKRASAAVSSALQNADSGRKQVNSAIGKLGTQLDLITKTVADLAGRKLYATDSNTDFPGGRLFNYNTTQTTPFTMAKEIELEIDKTRSVLITGICQSELKSGTSSASRWEGTSNLSIRITGASYSGSSGSVHRLTLEPNAAGAGSFVIFEQTSLVANMAATLQPGEYTVTLTATSTVFNNTGSTPLSIGTMRNAYLTAQVF